MTRLATGYWRERWLGERWLEERGYWGDGWVQRGSSVLRVGCNGNWVIGCVAAKSVDEIQRGERMLEELIEAEEKAMKRIAVIEWRRTAAISSEVDLP